MTNVPGGASRQNNHLQKWLSRHLLLLAAGGLLVLLVVFTVVLPSIHAGPSGPDPQEQIGLQWIKPVGSEAAYAGNGACKSCHLHEFQAYATSPHAHTVQAVAPGEMLPEFVSDQTVSDDRNDVKYTVRQEAGKNQVVATTDSSHEQGAVRWIFGSGNQARTYLTQEDSRFLQLRVSYYPPVAKWNFTPGSGPGTPFHEALGDPFTPGQAASCFGCHSTVLVGSSSHLDLTRSRLEVGCESCHGPCRSHVESFTQRSASAGGNNVAGNNMTHTASLSSVIPPRHNPQETMQLCGTCHRVPVAVKNENTAKQSELARFPGIALPRSRCFLASAGKMTCVTCHDPHQSAKHQQSAASFDLKCLNCHSAPHDTVCAKGEKSGCVTCHMPIETIARKLSLRFHNHWIRRDPSDTGLNLTQ